MGTTWMKSLKIGRKQTRTLSTAISDIIDYVKNPEKTEGGRLITSYACDSRIADEEFLLAKREYEFITGRNQGNRNVIAYHIRQSFLPGEVDPDTANKIGYELAMSFTKGSHSFIICTHSDKAHVHNHIIFNSTTIDCTRKFKDFWYSGKAVRRISDLLCAQYGLSIIENPKPSKGKNYGDWLGDNKPPTWSETIKNKIDEILPSCTTFEDFTSALRAAGFTVKDNRKHISVCAPGQKKPTRLDTLKGDYTEIAIRERIAGIRIVKVGGGGQRDAVPNISYSGSGGTSGGGHYSVSLLVDIQAKIREGKGSGYQQWAKIFNLKQAAKTLVFLQENDIDSYADLKKKSSSASGDFAALTTKIKEIETRQKEVTELQKYVGQYGKTRDTYAAYKASGWSRSFYDEHSADIILHRAAKKYFDGFGKKKLPSINMLKQEYATLAAEKKKLYSGYHELKENSRALAVAKGNADRILGIKPDAKSHDASREETRRDTHEI